MPDSEAWDEQDLHAWGVLAPLRGAYLPWSSASMRPSGLVAVLNEVALREPALVVECGSGVSTLFLARLLRERGTGRLVSVEHDPGWADWVRRTVAAEGLEGQTTVLHAALGADGWYATEALATALGDEEVGLLLVDGPPACGTGQGLAREPALPWFLPRLAAGAAVVLDDAGRPGEREVLARWEAAGTLRFEVLPRRGGIAIGRVPTDAPAFSI